MQAAIERVMQTYTMIVNLKPDEERAARQKVAAHLAGKPFERSGIAVRLISAVFGFDLGRAPVMTFFVLGSCRWRLMILGASGKSLVVASGGEMRWSTGPGCVGVSLFA